MPESVSGPNNVSFVSGSDGSTSQWSRPLRIRAGFLAEGEWVATPVGLAHPATGAQPGLARTVFEVSGDVASAVLYATALGVYQASVNGADVDDQVLKPGWTPYQWRLVHETTDVTDLLVPGANVLGLRFAGGWATERYGFRGQAAPFYTDQPSVAGQLVITYVDGRRQVVATDGSWRAAPGPWGPTRPSASTRRRYPRGGGGGRTGPGGSRPPRPPCACLSQRTRGTTRRWTLA